jgi:hypothetical protein
MKLNKNIKAIPGLILISVIGLTSCNKFGDTNVSPNASTTPVTSALLTNVETFLASDAIGSSTSTNTSPQFTFLAPYFVQHYSQIQYPDNQLYPTTGVAWDNYYAAVLEDLQNIINVCTKNPDPIALAGNTVNQIQIARILKAYYFSILTDKYGDVPYSQALTGALKVPYDKQQDIYNSLFTELKEAVAAFQNTGSAIKGDIIYAGNIGNWKRFANSLRLSLAMRLSKVDPTKGKTEFMAALGDAGGIIDNNTYNFKVAYPGGTFNNPIYNLATASVFAISKPLADMLNGYTDPRVFAYGQKNASNVVKGFPYGLNRTNAQAWIVSNPDYSLAYNTPFKSNNSTVFVFTAAYVDLLRAEAAITYTTGENAFDLTKKGIEDSWAQWGVTGDINAYLTAIGVSAGNTPIAKIQEQTWIALFGSEMNAFNEWRRTGVPALVAAPDATNPSKKIPRRFPYPLTEPNVNGEAYTAAKSSIPYGGTDDEISRVWWDKP